MPSDRRADRPGGTHAPVALPDIVSPFQASAATSPSAFWLFLLGLYLAFLLISFWVYRDARTRDMSPLLWLAVVFLVPVFGLVAYVIFRRERPA